MAVELDEQEAALYLSMMQLEEVVRTIDERLLTSLQSIAKESQRLADRRVEEGDPEPERRFHISLANLTGKPKDSVR